MNDFYFGALYVLARIVLPVILWVLEEMEEEDHAHSSVR